MDRHRNETLKHALFAIRIKGKAEGHRCSGDSVSAEVWAFGAELVLGITRFFSSSQPAVIGRRYSCRLREAAFCFQRFAVQLRRFAKAFGDAWNWRGVDVAQDVRA